MYLWDYKKGHIESDALKNCHHLIHLAGAGIAEERWTFKRKKVLIESRVDSSAFLCQYIKENKNCTFVCLDEVTDPRNIGSLIRSAASFKIDGLIIKERHFPKDSKLMYKSASGCMEHLNIFQVSNINSTLKNLREKNFWVYGFDARGDKDFTEVKWEGKNVLLFGSEGFGMREHTGKYADFFVKIDINKDIESLNISNSAAIVFHHLDFVKKKS